MAQRLPRLRGVPAALAIAALFALCAYSQESEPAVPPVPDTQAVPSDLPASGATQSDAPPPAFDKPSSDPLEKWLNSLAFAESGNRQHLVHRDRDGQLYYGCLQFQAHTFRAYVRKLRLLPFSTSAQVMSRIYDCAFQKRLAAAMIRDDPNNWKHWRTTVEKRVGLPPVETGSLDPIP